MYKIKRITDGLFSKGGAYEPYFTKTGKVWNTLGGLKLHLQQFLDGTNFSLRPSNLYHDCIVVMYDDINGGIKEDVFDIQAYFVEKRQELIERDNQNEIRRQEYNAKLRALKEQYGQN